MESYWNSSYVDLSPKFNCAEASEHDNNTTVFTSQVIVASYSMLFYLILLFVSVLGVCFNRCVNMISSQATSMLFLIGTLMVFVNIFTNSNELDVKIYFRLVGGFMVGIVFMIFGALLFFSDPERAHNQSTLRQQQPSMGFVVAAITIPLIITEVFLLASAFAASKDTIESRQCQRLWILILSDKLTFLVQKITQAIIYIILRYKTFSPRYEENAKFYFKILSFFNLVEWVDSQVNEDSDVKLSGAEEIYGDWFAVFAMFYKALIIDYRLLCSLLFLEHSLEDEADGESGESNELVARNLTSSDQRCRSLSFMVGFTSLSAPICCALYYIPKLEIPPWIHVFTIVVYVAVIGFSAVFLFYNDLPSSENNEGSGVKIMVCCLGAVGFTCWMTKAPLTAYWALTDAVQSSYLSWVAAKYIARGVTTVFLMGLFLKVDARTMPLNNLNVERNHFLLPVLMLTILGTFLESLIGQHVSLDSRLQYEIKELSLKILFGAGPPMYLGFLIHVFLHLVVIHSEIAKQPRDPSVAI